MSALNAYRTALSAHHNEHERWEGLFEIQNEFDDVTFWRIYRELYDHSQILFPHLELIRRMLSAERINSTARLAAWTDEDREWMKRMVRRDRMVKVYRGASRQNLTGLSYSTNIQVAKKHAVECGSAFGTLVIGRVEPRYAILAKHDERELMIFPEHVKVEEMIDVPGMTEQRRMEKRLNVLVAQHGANYPLQITPVEYFRRAISEGHIAREEVVNQLSMSRKFLDGLGFKKRIERIDEILGGI